MKVLLTMNLPYTPAHGGAIKAARCLLEELSKKHHTVEAVVPALPSPSPLTREQFRDALRAQGLGVEVSWEADLFRLRGVRVHAVALPSRLRPYLAGRIRDFAPDCVVVSTEDPSLNLLETAVKA